MKLKSHSMLSGGQISCRMYKGFAEAVQGFSKNFMAFFGNSYVFSFIFMLFSSLGLLISILSMNWTIIAAYFAIFILMKILVSIVSRQNIFNNLVLTPFQLYAMWAIYIRALQFQRGDQISWKGRKI